MHTRDRLVVLAIPLAILLLVIAALATDRLMSLGVGGPVTAASPEPTASSACRPFAATAELATHTGPLPPQSAWDRLATGGSNGATSLPEATSFADLVLVGRWAGSERFGSLGDPGDAQLGHYAVAVIRVDRLIHGALPPGCVDLVRVPFLLEFGSAGSPYPESAFTALERTRPEDPAMLFLRSWAGTWDRAGGELPEWVAPLDRYDIYRTIGLDGALPLEDGSVSDVVFENDMPVWRLDLAGKGLDAVTSQIVAAAELQGP